MVQRYIREYADTRIDRYSEKSARFRYLFERLQRTACAIVNNVADEMRRSDFKLMEFELSFGGREADLPAVSVERGGHLPAPGG